MPQFQSLTFFKKSWWRFVSSHELCIGFPTAFLQNDDLVTLCYLQVALTRWLSNHASYSTHRTIGSAQLKSAVCSMGLSTLVRTINIEVVISVMRVSWEPASSCKNATHTPLMVHFKKWGRMGCCCVHKVKILHQLFPPQIIIIINCNLVVFKTP